MRFCSQLGLLAWIFFAACAYQPVLNSEPVSVGDEGLEQYWMLARIDPMDYPAEARRRGIEGRVDVDCLIDSNGRVAEAVVVEAVPPGVFDGVAIAAARSMQYLPAPTNREMKPVRTIKVFEYLLPEQLGGGEADRVHAFEIEWIVWMQQQGGPALDRFFAVYTDFGGSYYLYLIPLVLWCVDYRMGLRLLALFTATVFLNTTLKEWLGQPRPFQVDPRVSSDGEMGYGLPSGHAQLVVVFWGVIAGWVDRRWFWCLAVLIMFLMGFSRIYLGVHFISDVALGWALGAVTLVPFLRFVPDLERRQRALPVATVARWALGAAAFCFLFDLLLVGDHGRLIAGAAGFTAGGGVGGAVAVRSLEFSGHGAWWQRALRLVLGVPLTLVFLGLMRKLGVPAGSAGNLVVAADLALFGIWLTLAAPWLFERLRLSPTARA